MSLVDIYDVMSSQDDRLEKAAAIEFEKLAEEDAAGRIMARGFMDELNKLAAGAVVTTSLPKPPATKPATRTRNIMGRVRAARGGFALNGKVPGK